MKIERKRRRRRRKRKRRRRRVEASGGKMEEKKGGEMEGGEGEEWCGVVNVRRVNGRSTAVRAFAKYPLKFLLPARVREETDTYTCVGRMPGFFSLQFWVLFVA